MLGDVDAAAEPYVLKTPHVIENPDQPGATPRPSDQPVMQADGPQLPRAFLAPAPENPEGVAHVAEKGVAGHETAASVEAAVARPLGIWLSQSPPAAHRHPCI